MPTPREKRLGSDTALTSLPTRTRVPPSPSSPWQRLRLLGVSTLPGPALTSSHDIGYDRPRRRGHSGAEGERPGEGELSGVEVSAAPRRLYRPPPADRSEGAAPDLGRNTVYWGAGLSREWAFSSLIGVVLSTDGLHGPKRAGS